jgi:hypothetical protein
MSRYHIAGLAGVVLMSWALVVTEPSPHIVKADLPTKEACEKAAVHWRSGYKQHLKQANATNDPNRRRRLNRSVPPTKCVEYTNAPATHH